MKIAAIPISVTTLNWNIFQRTTMLTLKRSVTAPLDTKAIIDRGLAEAIVAFAEFQSQHVDYLATLRSAGVLLRHFTVSFLLFCDNQRLMYELAAESDLRIILCDDSDQWTIATADLHIWHTTVINYASHRATVSQRVFAIELLQAFDHLGLGKLWDNYSRQGGVLVEK